MRRKDREITDPAEIRQIILGSHCCRLGFCDGDEAYIVPLNFGYEETEGKRIFYFHSAREGRKIDLIRAGGCVGFELDTNFVPHPAEKACEFSAGFQSVIGSGRARLVEDEAGKRHGLQCILEHLSNKADWDFPREMVEAVAVIKLEVEALSCKEHK